MGLPLKVDIWFAADIYRDPVDRPAREAVRALAGVVKRHWIAHVAADGQPFAGEHVAAWLGLDATFADFGRAVVEGEDACGEWGWVLVVLLEGGRQDQARAGRHVLSRHDSL